jgi:predicted  nucleic acid-binding Zn-ribbon protein
LEEAKAETGNLNETDAPDSASPPATPPPQDHLQSQITLLKQIQDHDVVILEMEKLLKEYPARIESLKAKSGQACAERDALKSQLTEFEIKRRDKEGRLKMEEDTVRRWEGRLRDIKTHREYQALQKEIFLSKKDNERLADEIIKDLEDQDKLQTQYEEKVKEEAGLSSSSSTEIQDLENKMQEANAKLAHETEGRVKIAPLIKPDILINYETIIRKGGKAVVETIKGMCTGCNMNIPPQTFIEVMKNKELIACPNCRRILYWKKEP